MRRDPNRIWWQGSEALPPPRHPESSWGDALQGLLPEPEVHFLRDVDVDVPDLAGWRRERMPRIPRGHRSEIVPDWICEILSSSTEGKDRDTKMPIYAKYGVAHAWLPDPCRRTIEVYRLDTQEWRESNRFTGDHPARIPPFDAVPLDLAALWIDDQD